MAKTHAKLQEQSNKQLLESQAEIDKLVAANVSNKFSDLGSLSIGQAEDRKDPLGDGSQRGEAEREIARARA